MRKPARRLATVIKLSREDQADLDSSQLYSKRKLKKNSQMWSPLPLGKIRIITEVLLFAQADEDENVKKLPSRDLSATRFFAVVLCRRKKRYVPAGCFSQPPKIYPDVWTEGRKHGSSCTQNHSHPNPFPRREIAPPTTREWVEVPSRPWTLDVAEKRKVPSSMRKKCTTSAHTLKNTASQQT